jgi:hypothetical protein
MGGLAGIYIRMQAHRQADRQMADAPWFGRRDSAGVNANTLYEPNTKAGDLKSDGLNYQKDCLISSGIATPFPVFCSMGQGKCISHGGRSGGPSQKKRFGGGFWCGRNNCETWELLWFTEGQRKISEELANQRPSLLAPAKRNRFRR